MGAKHTPGPWKAVLSRCGWGKFNRIFSASIETEDGRVVALISDINVQEEYGAACTEEDARLIARAPDLDAECVRLRAINEKLLAFAKAHEAWEGKLILDDDAWDGGHATLPTLTDDLWDEFLAIQKMRNDAVAMAMSAVPPPVSGGSPDELTDWEENPTAGPWKWMDYPDGRKLLVASNRAVIHCPDSAMTVLSSDARAIAAVPELLEACRLFSAWDSGPHLTDSSLDPVRKAVYVALTKVQGYAPPPVSGGAPADPMGMPRKMTEAELWRASDEAWEFFQGQRRRDVP